jgi:hypothetical protein
MDFTTNNNYRLLSCYTVGIVIGIGIGEDRIWNY